MSRRLVFCARHFCSNANPLHIQQIIRHSTLPPVHVRGMAMASGGDKTETTVDRDGSAAETSTKPKAPFGTRLLKDPNKVFEHNAWDHVEWDEEQETTAKKKVEENSKSLASEEAREKFELNADKFWDVFYTQHQNRFFKDRHWLFTEFPELAPEREEEHPKDSETGQHPKDSETGLEGVLENTKIAENTNEHPEMCEEKSSDFVGCNANSRILEVGCGVGNTVFPIMQTNNDPSLFVYCCDFSSTAIDLVKSHPDYNVNRCHAFVCDVVDESIDLPFPENSLDIIVLIFVLSAIHPDKMQNTINRLARHLKPGGLLLFRDYGRYDMAQLRFKKGSCLSDNFYARGDGTRVYFFTQDELNEMFTLAGLVQEQNLVDRRLQVNRGRQLKMYRVWIQCKYRKPLQSK